MSSIFSKIVGLKKKIWFSNLKIFFMHPLCWLAFIIFTIIGVFTRIIFLFFYFIFSFGWLIKLYNFHKKKINEIKPIKYELKGDIFTLFLFTEIVIKPHLYSFSVIYLNYKNRITGNKTSKIDFFLSYFYNFAVRLITGIAKNIIKNSFEWSLKFAFYDKKIGLESYLFTILSNNFYSLLSLEKLRIYRSKKSKVKFNPGNPNSLFKNKDALRTFIKENPDAMKEGSKILNNSPMERLINEMDVRKVNTSFKDPNSNIIHGGTVYKFLKKNKWITIFNKTSQENINIKKENLINGDKEVYVKNPVQIKFRNSNKTFYIIQPQTVYEDALEFKKIVYNLNDTRQIAIDSKVDDVVNAHLIALQNYENSIILNKNGKYNIQKKNGTYLGWCLNNSLSVEDDILEIEASFLSIAKDTKYFEESIYVKLTSDQKKAFSLATMEVYNPLYMELLDKFNFDKKKETNILDKIKFNKGDNNLDN